MACVSKEDELGSLEKRMVTRSMFLTSFRLENNNKLIKVVK
jgi:hypothetical protein